MTAPGRELRRSVSVTAADLHERGPGVRAPAGLRDATRWWVLRLACGHDVARAAAYAARTARRRRGQPVIRTRDEVRPAPRHARCDHCPPRS